MQETQVQSLGGEDPLEEEMETHSSILAWRISTDRGAWQATVHGVAKSWTWLSMNVPHTFLMLGNFSAIISSNLNIVSNSFSFLHIIGWRMWMLVHLILSQRSLRVSSFLFIVFFFIPWKWFPPLCLSAHLFVFLPHLLCYCAIFLLFIVFLPFSVYFFIAVIVFFFCLFFKSSSHFRQRWAQ